MFNFVREPAQPIGDHPLWPWPLRVAGTVSNFAYIYNLSRLCTQLDFPLDFVIPISPSIEASDSIQGIRTTSVRFINGGLPGH